MVAAAAERSEVTHSIRVIPANGEWFVDFDDSRFAVPTGKGEAVKTAVRLASGLRVLQVTVCDKDGTVIEVIDVVHRRKP